jgi:hypothetical protein
LQPARLDCILQADKEKAHFYLPAQQHAASSATFHAPRPAAPGLTHIKLFSSRQPLPRHFSKRSLTVLFDQ